MIDGEHGRNRTYNLRIKSPLLCQLSYVPTVRLNILHETMLRRILCRCIALHRSPGFQAGQIPASARCLHKIYPVFGRRGMLGVGG